MSQCPISAEACVLVMNWIVPAASFLEILLLLYVAMMDIATRLIRN
jgi:hypothetical protein